MNAITEEILELLYDLVARPHRIVYGYFPEEYSRNSIQVALKRLENKGFIEKGMKEDEVCVQLSELGVKELERRRKKRREEFTPKLKNKGKWDGIWRMVIFDIPEKNKKVRKALRKTLRILEFYPLQKSVWVSKSNYTKELRKWVKDLELTNYIRVVETKSLG